MYKTPHSTVYQPDRHFEGALIDLAHDRIRLGPNEVSAIVFHADGSYTDCGISHNVMTTANNGGRDQVAAMLGGALGFGVTGTIATGSSSTSLTATATPFVASAYIGQIVVAEETTNAPVHATIISNTTSVLTVDAWRNGDDSTGTTPGTTANYHIIAGNASARYIALTENASAASASSTSLTGEITTGGCGRALGTYAHTLGASTLTLVKSFSVSGTFPAIHRAGLFQVSTASSAILSFETVLNADANVISGDTLQVTWTITLDLMVDKLIPFVETVEDARVKGTGIPVTGKRPVIQYTPDRQNVRLYCISCHHPGAFISEDIPGVIFVCDRFTGCGCNCT